MIPIRPTAALLGLWMLAACGPGGEMDLQGPFSFTRIAPPGAPPGTCWDRITTPAIVETVTLHVLVHAAELADDGTVLQPASYRTETRQQIVQDRTETWFEIPCSDVLTPDFVSSLQRALQVRGLYDGPITGKLDGPTRAAVLTYQRQQGLESETLALETARGFGLIEVMPQE